MAHVFVTANAEKNERKTRPKRKLSKTSMLTKHEDEKHTGLNRKKHAHTLL